MLVLLALLAPAATLAVAAPTPQFFTYYGLGASFAEARDHVNLQWAVSWTGDTQELEAQLLEARAAGVKALVHPEFLFFEGTCPYSLRADAATRWHSFADTLAREGLLDTVVAVYPLDEPDLCGVPERTVQDVIGIIRAEPLTADKKVAGIFTADVARRWGGHYRLTRSEHEYADALRAYDWVGFDCYTCAIFTDTAWNTVRFDASKPGFVTVPGPTLYDNFKSQLDLSRQQVILVPQASVGGPQLGTAYDDPLRFRDAAAADHDVVLLLPFTWLDQGAGVSGVRSLPALRSAYTQIGRAIDWQHPEVSPAPPPVRTAIEFYNAPRGHYFVTANPEEIRKLDAGDFEGWARTGAQWSVWVQPVSDPAAARGSPVCRFYGRPEAGLDSHFYSASPDECAAVKARFGYAWIVESDDVFEVQLPDAVTGACPLATSPMYRLFNNRLDVNHRYTPSAAVHDAMAAAGWIPEGYGPDATAMCVPQ